MAVTSFAGAVSALRECDLLCTMAAVQSHSVLNTGLLKTALVQHTFTVLLPLPRAEGSPDAAGCVWRAVCAVDAFGHYLVLAPSCTRAHN